MSQCAITIIGRPNVGKSTLFNILTRSRDAIVDNFAGVTCDRHYGQAQHNDQDFIVIDTGGFSEELTHPLQHQLNEQVQLAIEEADLVLFMVDAKVGLCSTDFQLAKQLRASQTPTIIIANKAENIDEQTALVEMYQLGFSSHIAISASHKQGIDGLWELIEISIDNPEYVAKNNLDQLTGLKLAIVGKPNSGKSTLVNQLLGKEQVLVSEIPGTTRDSIHLPIIIKNKPYVLIDTAGLRRKARIDSKSIERYSVLRTLKSIVDADVVLLLIDATEGVSDQDCKLLQYIEDSGRALVLGLNKWDLLDADEKKQTKEHLAFRFRNLAHIDCHTLSAIKGRGIDKIFTSIRNAHQAATKQLTTSKLTQLLMQACAEYPAPMHKGRRIRCRYAHPGGHQPPHIIIHGKQTQALPNNYKKYLMGFFRKKLNLHGTPIRLSFKNDANPYAHK